MADSSVAYAFAEPSTETSSYAERINWLRLIRSENVGIKTFQSLLKLYGSAESAIENAADLAKRGGKDKAISIYSRKEAEEELEQCEKIGARIITGIDPEYPALLRQISDAPPVITVLGDTALLNKQSIAIVGARNATANGCRFSYRIAENLGKNYMVVSGLARGIDTAAHKGSLETGTIAVIAGGIDHIYPRENEALYNEIKEKGAIIAELPFGSVPKAQHFPQRNRLISGLSLGTLVVEASARSGSLITARLALEHNREVFAVPGSPLDPRAEGPNKLIKQGAILVESVDDILNNIHDSSHHRQMGMFEEAVEPAEDESIIPDEQDLDSARDIVKSNLSTTPVLINELISQTGLSPQSVQVILLELELAGNLIRHPGNRASLLA